MKILINPNWLKNNFDYFIKDQHIQDVDIEMTLMVKDFAVIKEK